MPGTLLSVARSGPGPRRGGRHPSRRATCTKESQERKSCVLFLSSHVFLCLFIFEAEKGRECVRISSHTPLSNKNSRPSVWRPATGRIRVRVCPRCRVTLRLLKTIVPKSQNHCALSFSFPGLGHLSLGSGLRQRCEDTPGAQSRDCH